MVGEFGEVGESVDDTVKGFEIGRCRVFFLGLGGFGFDGLGR